MGKTLVQALQTLGAFLADSPAHDAALTLLRASPVVSPLAQVAHIIGFSIVIGAAGAIALRVLGIGVKSQAPQEMARRLYPWLGGALVVLVLTGSLLFLARPDRYLINPAFQLKMALLIANLVLTALLAAALPRRHVIAPWTTPRGAALRLAAGLSLAIWIATILAGRMIAYVSDDLS